MLSEHDRKEAVLTVEPLTNRVSQIYCFKLFADAPIDPTHSRVPDNILPNTLQYAVETDLTMDKHTVKKYMQMSLHTATAALNI